uniref:Uncharacterized protein n=2 Tax=Corethron hystrix TaxID=216773 RepID=A0A7S1B7F2_9STRA|mmetsp:Transcript_1555/g.3272  ORF Transcript_1555/g.3272 Transcript_1555/m.3272 type:complete len:149 (+) Transcript_1555:84-530(+)
MASRLVALLRMMPLFGDSGRTVRPNSYAIVSMWKRYLEEKADAEAEAEAAEENAAGDGDGGDVSRADAAASREAALRQFVADGHRSSATRTAAAAETSGGNAPSGGGNFGGGGERLRRAREAELEMLERPNLRVPSAGDDDAYLYLPQ